MATSYYSILTSEQIEDIHRAALRILDEVGVQVESKELLSLLSDYGGTGDPHANRIRYAPSWVEQFIAESDRYDWDRHAPGVYCLLGIYESQYLNPETDELESFTEASFRDCVRLGRGLPGVDDVCVLGLPFAPEGIPAAYSALTEKLWGWKYGAAPSGTVQFTGLCPYIEDMYARRAEELGRPLEDVFGATGYLITPLRLARPECEQVLYFKSRGLRMGIGHLASLGCSTPITIAGAAALQLAESLFLSIFQRALWGGRSLNVGSSTMVMDMRTSASLFGRPEQPMLSTISAQLARFYGTRASSHAGLTDARRPSVEAGMQKAVSVVSGLCSCGSASIDAGLLCVDEVLSPEQAVHDAELVGALRRMLEPVDVSEESLAVADVKEVGPGGSFIGTDLTAARFRSDVWQPTVWDRASLQEWLRTDGKTDSERAKERVRDILSTADEEQLMSEECERDLRAIIDRAVAREAAA